MTNQKYFTLKEASGMAARILNEVQKKGESHDLKMNEVVENWVKNKDQLHFYFDITCSEEDYLSFFNRLKELKPDANTPVETEDQISIKCDDCYVAILRAGEKGERAQFMMSNLTYDGKGFYTEEAIVFFCEVYYLLGKIDPNQKMDIVNQRIKTAHSQLNSGDKSGKSTTSSASADEASKCYLKIEAGQIDVTFDDVAGIDDVKAEVVEIIDYLKNPERYTKMGAKIPKGVLLSGLPGTGKTLLAKAIAGEADVPFYHMSGSEFVEMFVGVGASRVRELFTDARENEVAIIFIDEIDAVGKTRDSGGSGGSDERNQTLNQILVEMDGFKSDKNLVIVIGATNRPETLDPALLRPGRLTKEVHVNLPDKKGREEILKIHSKGLTLGDNIDIAHIAGCTTGFSGASLAELWNESALTAVRRKGDFITMTDVDQANDRITMGIANRSRIIPKESLKNTAIHEMGHVFCGAFEDDRRSPMNKVTIIPRGSAAGFVDYGEAEEDFATYDNFMSQLVSNLGGRCAEELILGHVTTGPSSDLNQVTSLAQKMVKDYGMCSKALGLRTFGESMDKLSGKMVSGDVSDETAALIDSEIKRLTDEAYKRASAIVTKYKELIKEFAELLLERETMDAFEIYELLLEKCEKDDKEIIQRKLEKATLLTK